MFESLQRILLAESNAAGLIDGTRACVDAAQCGRKSERGNRPVTGRPPQDWQQTLSPWWFVVPKCCSSASETTNRWRPLAVLNRGDFLAEYPAGEAQNQEAVESAEVMWISRNAVPRFISVDTIFPPILSHWGSQHD
ncbi:hypothetical protein [Kitasatospora griseola]|uniref:hypothetical protein n=1 Tax=Kitasatospora griseola TaxID=2064 RepID=UPI0016701E62|nr:hypothetical protein [Kitasatospora griseola]GGQ98126.1 hypothetical protein GCM10010195_62400 [Kitasatospora griseola]